MTSSRRSVFSRCSTTDFSDAPLGSAKDGVSRPGSLSTAATKAAAASTNLQGFNEGQFACPLQSEIWLGLHDLLGASTVCGYLAVNALHMLLVENRTNTFVYSDSVRLLSVGLPVVSPEHCTAAVGAWLIARRALVDSCSRCIHVCAAPSFWPLLFPLPGR